MVIDGSERDLKNCTFVLSKNRYASQAWLDRMAEVNSDRSLRLAGHLCSTRCEQVLKGDQSFVASLHDKVKKTTTKKKKKKPSAVELYLINGVDMPYLLLTPSPPFLFCSESMGSSGSK
jgi:hypothetical protein